MVFETGLNAFAKSIYPCQPAHMAQADMDQNFLLPSNHGKVSSGLLITLRNTQFENIVRKKDNDGNQH